MVQVDVFWSYGLGAGFAFGAARQLKALGAGQAPHADEDTETAMLRDAAPFNNRFFMVNLIFLSCLFAPSGIYLLWQFTSWETMHVLDKTMPAWLVTGFAITNVTQGILGFWVTQKCIRSGKAYQGFLQIILGYFFMFFILVHGWDGTGYRRFFSPTRADFLAWDPANVPAWFTSPVALTLYAMGVILIPVIFYYFGRWMQDGYALAGIKKHPGWGAIVVLLLLTVFGAGLGSAIACSLLIHWIGWIAGAAAFAVAAALLLVRRGGLFHMLYKAVYAEAG
jgi:hypothetical protein